jgi:CspA family cold shock protein
MVLSGTIKFFNPERGFGFIRRDDGEEDVFVHANMLDPADVARLVQHQRVVFGLGSARSSKGPKAAWVRPDLL